MSPFIDNIDKQIRDGFHKSLKLKLIRPDLIQVAIPYYYPDGDMIDVYIKELKDDTVLIQDLGMTLMRLSYDFAVDTANKRKLLAEIIGNYDVLERNNNLELITPKAELFPYLMQFIQVVTKVSDISYLKRETVKSLFYEYFSNFVSETFQGEGLIKEYYPDFDIEKQYPTPYALLKIKDSPICFYPIASDEKCNETTITIQHYELHNFRPKTIAVFENQEAIGRKPLARLSNIVEKQFASLSGNEGRIVDYAKRLYA